MRATRRVAGIGAQALVIAAALAFAALMLVPRLLGWQIVTVLSGSMAPTYPTYSILAVAPVDPHQVHVGDVVAFQRGPDTSPVTHRIAAIDTSTGSPRFTTKGDANEDPDPDAVAASEIKGRVVFGVPWLGRAVRALRSPASLAVLLLLPALALLGQRASRLGRGLLGRRPTSPTANGGPDSATLSPSAVATPADDPARPSGVLSRCQLLLATIAAEGVARRDVLNLIALFGGTLDRATPHELTMSFSGDPDRINVLEGLIADLDVVALERSAVIAVPAAADRAAGPAPEPSAASTDAELVGRLT